MNDQRLRRILRSVLISAPLPLAILGAACGGSSSGDPFGAGGESAAGASGSASGGAGSAGHAGATSAGAGGASAGSAGASSAGASSAGANSAGANNAGSGGAVANDCANPGGHAFCSSYSFSLPKHCVSADTAMVGQSLSMETCETICGGQFPLCSVTNVDASSVTFMCNPGCAIGRRPAGLCEPEARSASALGAYFAQIAHLEAASVTAFRVLRDELRAKGAPPSLVRAAARAARDEVRHARSTGALARRFGARPAAVAVTHRAQRSIEAMALENAVEGCVRETYGALLATRQAERARDPGVRAAMQRIARDETRHAALSWRVGHWLESRLDPVGKRKVARAKQAAASELRAALAAELAPSFAELLGLPTPDEAVRMADEMARQLWS